MAVNAKTASMMVKMILLVVALALLPDLAFAQTPPSPPADGYTLPESDLSRRTFIDPLFGPISGAGTDSPLTAVISVFNTALLFVAGLLMAYTIVSGAMSTAHDGEVLGKKWSTMWVPIRTALGVGAIMPVVGGGWCVAQVIVIWLAMQGAQIANLTWSAFVGDGQSLMAGAVYLPPSNQPQLRQAMSEMLVNNVCVEAHRSEFDETSASANDIMEAKSYEVFDKSGSRPLMTGGSARDGIPPQRTGTTEIVRYEYGYPDDGDNCGAVEMRDIVRNSDVASGGQGETGLGGELFNIDTISLGVGEARRAAFQDIQKDLNVLAKEIVAGTADSSKVQSEMDRLLSDYSQSTGDAAHSAWERAVNKDMLAAMKADGWAMAGAFYMMIAKSQDSITAQLSKVPVSNSSGRQTGVGKVWNYIVGEDHGDSVVAAMRRTDEMLADAKVASAGGVSSIGDAKAEGAGGWENKMLGWFMGEQAFSFGDDASSMRDVNQNPIVMAQGLGNKMVTWAGAALLGATAAAFLTGPATPGGWSLIGPVLSALVGVLMVPGAILSTYLPMMPYILWIGAMLGWGILLVEAVIAAPLWAVAHIAPDGDGVAGRGGTGYMLVLSLVLRPALMVIGLVAAMVLLKPIGFLINSTFVGAFAMTDQGFSIATLVRLIAGCIIYCVLMIMMVQRTFSLIHVIPDRLMRWIGGGGDNAIGEHAQAAGEGLTKAAAGVGATMAVSQGAQQGVQALAAHKRAKLDLDQQKRQGAAQEENNMKLGNMSEDNQFNNKRDDAENDSARANETGAGSDHTRAANSWTAAGRLAEQAASTARENGNTERALQYDDESSNAKELAAEHRGKAANSIDGAGADIRDMKKDKPTDPAPTSQPSSGSGASDEELASDLQSAKKMSQRPDASASDHTRVANAAERLAERTETNADIEENAGNKSGASELRSRADDLKMSAKESRARAEAMQSQAGNPPADENVRDAGTQPGSAGDHQEPTRPATTPDAASPSGSAASTRPDAPPTNEPPVDNDPRT